MVSACDHFGRTGGVGAVLHRLNGFLFEVATDLFVVACDWSLVVFRQVFVVGLYAAGLFLSAQGSMFAHTLQLSFLLLKPVTVVELEAFVLSPILLYDLARNLGYYRRLLEFLQIGLFTFEFG